MKHIFFLTVIYFCSFTTHAQNELGKSDDAARIAIKAYIPDNFGDITPKAQDALRTRLERILTKNGLAGASYDQRFILTAKVVEMRKDFVPGTPPIYNYELEVTLMIGDAVEGTLFATNVTDVKGAGNTQTDAYLSAIKKLKDSDPGYQAFIENGKTKIIEYYNSRCDFILKEAESLVGQNEFQAAIATLTAIPDICKACYDKAVEAVAPVYQMQIDRQCKLDLAEAVNAWNESQDGSGASAASSFLSQIDPNSSCYAEARNFSSKIASRIRELDQREWDFKLKQQQDVVDIQKTTIKAARDIGVAYGKNQPRQIVYNIRTWW